MVGCDLLMCHVLQDASAQIVADCKLFGAKLQGACGKAMDQLPGKDEAEGSAFDCSDACFRFLSAFGLLSDELLQIAGDLESTVTVPLKSAIATLTEESLGRMKHWRQVKARLQELQERYRRSRQRVASARKKMDGDHRFTFRKPSSNGQAASEQQAAINALARCEDELKESEASLLRLEDESRERLRQLDGEKRALLRGALHKGTGSLRRLICVADKVSVDLPPPPDDWQPVVPQSFPSGAAGAAVPNREGARQEVLHESSHPRCNARPRSSSPSPPPRQDSDGTAVEASPCALESRTSAQVAEDGEPESQGVAEAKALGRRGSEALSTPGAAARQGSPSSRYLANAGATVATGPIVAEDGEVLEIGDGSDGSGPEEAASRALAWSPTNTRQTPQSLRSKRTLVFQSGGLSLTAESNVLGASGAAPPLAASPLAAPRAASAVGAEAGPAACPATPERSTASRRAPEALPQASPGWPRPSPPSRAVSSSCGAEDSDEDELMPSRRKELVLLERPEVDLEVSPVMAENPQRSFECYVRRLTDRLASTTLTSWDTLQERAQEKILGGHVGKLELFWLHAPGAELSPEAAVGLVCFQFVQGFAGNFARVLHLSVVGEDPQAGPMSPNASRSSSGETVWPLLPSAIFVVRRFVLGSLPVDSIRCVVLAGADDTGRIYVDGDVEVAYQQSRFRWFQLTQSLRRTRNALGRRGKLKLSSRFIVLHTLRNADDPAAPSTGMSTLPALVLRDDSSMDAFTESKAEETFASW